MAGPEQANAGAAAAAGAAQRPREPPMFRPEKMRSLPVLSDQEKQKYEQGLRQLWQQVDSNPADSQLHQEARKKIAEFSRMLMTKMQQRRIQQAAGGAQGAAAAASAQQPQAPSAQQQLQAGGNAGAQHAGAPGAGAATGQEQAHPVPAAQPGKLPDHIMAHMAKMTFHPPPNIRANPELAQKWVNDAKQKYARGLLQMENTKSRLNQIEHLLRSRAAEGAKPFNPNELQALLTQKEKTQAAYNDAMRFVENFRKTQESLAAAAAGTATSTAAVTKAQANGGATAIPAPAVGAARGQAAIGAAMDEAKKQQAAATGGGGTAPIGSMAQQPTQSHVPIPVPVGAQPAVPIQQTPVPIPIPGGGVQHPPPVNTALAAAAAAGAGGAAGTPTRQTPQSAAAAVATPTSAVPGSARALSHQAALSKANAAHMSQPGAVPLGGAPQPGVGAGQGAAGAHPASMHAQPQHPQHTGPQQTLQSKLPIPKQLPERATQVPVPVAMGGGVQSGRPTYTSGSGVAGGVMGQPVVPKVPGFQLEGEGERVLNKKKLDELVRQVCGGTAEGQDGNMLAPEVEEAVLNMADSFVDSVLHAACRIAKERGAKTLEIRDIQLVLERGYNIRIPGYSSEELRMVRKIQPSAAWINKMSAVQAAKVMPGKDAL